MRKILLLLTLIISTINSRSIAQSYDLTLTTGYLYNLTTHWIVDSWEHPLNIRLKYTRDRIILRYGGGVNLSNYNIAWIGFYHSDNYRITEITPFISLGRYFTRDRLSFNPYLNLGYTLISTNIGFFSGKKGALYLSPGADLNFRIAPKIYLGINAAYHLTLTPLEFNIAPWTIPHYFVTTEGRVIHSLNLGLNLVYSLN